MVGSVNISGGVAGKFHDVEEIIVHDGFNKTAYIHDIALLKLQSRIAIFYPVWPIKYDAPVLEGGEQVELTGWGRLNVTRFFSIRLKERLFSEEKHKRMFSKMETFFPL